MKQFTKINFNRVRSSIFGCSFDTFVSVFFLAACALFYPLQLSFHTVPYKMSLQIFNMTSLSIIALAFICFKIIPSDLFFYHICTKICLIIREPIRFQYKTLIKSFRTIGWLPVCLFVFLFIIVIQSIVLSFTLEEFLFSLLWITIPVFAFIYYDTLKKYFKIFIIYLFIFNFFYILIYSFMIERLPGRLEMMGITGNRNTHAAFIIFSLFIIFSTICTRAFFLVKKMRLFKSRKEMRNVENHFSSFIYLFLFIFVFIISFYILYYCHSRGAWISIFIVLILFILIEPKMNWFSVFAFFGMKSNNCKKSINRNIKDHVSSMTLEYKGFFTYRRVIYFSVICCIIFTFMYLQRDNIEIYIQKTIDFSKDQVLNSNSELPKKRIKINALGYMQDISAGKYFGRPLNQDIRPSLWNGAFNMFQERWLIGVGTPRFENEYAEYLPISYFMKAVAAFRTEHPHNTILYVADCFGLFGLIAWIILFIYPVIVLLQKYSSLQGDEKIYLWGYLFLLLQSMVGKTFFAWPTLLFALLTVGFLWRIKLRIVDQKDTKAVIYGSISNKSDVLNSKVETQYFASNCNKRCSLNSCLYRYVKILSVLIGVMLFVYGMYYSYNLYKSSSFFRKGEIESNIKNNKLAALYFYKKSLGYNVNGETLYKIAIIKMELEEYSNALLYLNLFDQINFSNYTMVNYWRGYCYYQLEEYQDALKYFEKQVMLYPVMVSSWYGLMLTQKKLGMTNAAEESWNTVLMILKMKKLSLEILSSLLKNLNADLKYIQR